MFYTTVKLLASVFSFSRHCTAVDLSHVYWFYVTRVTLRCTSARTLVDLRRCGVVFLGKAFSALVSYTEMVAFITQLTVNSTLPRTPGVDGFHILL